MTHDKNDGLDAAHLIAIHSMSAGAAGFDIPLFGYALNSNALYIQKVLGADIISGFELIEPEESQLLSVSHRAVQIGDKRLHAVTSTNGQHSVGSRDELAEGISRWVSEVSDPLVRMGLAEFGGQLGVAAKAASQVLALRRGSVRGEGATKWFLDVIVRKRIVSSVLWECSSEEETVRVESSLERCRVFMAAGKAVLYLTEDVYEKSPQVVRNPIWSSAKAIVEGSLGVELKIVSDQQIHELREQLAERVRKADDWGRLSKERLMRWADHAGLDIEDAEVDESLVFLRYPDGVVTRVVR